VSATALSLKADAQLIAAASAGTVGAPLLSGGAGSPTWSATSPLYVYSANSNLAAGTSGQRALLKNISNGAITVTGTGTGFVVGMAAAVSTLTLASGASAMLVSDGTNWLQTYESVPPAPPTVESLLGPLSGTVTITGTGFIVGNTMVKIGSADAVAANVISATSATVSVPVGTAGTTVALWVTTPGGTYTDATYTYVPVPTITNLSPASGPLVGGTLLTITGTGYIAGATAVTVGGTGVAIATISGTSITAMSPVRSTTGAVSVIVSTPGGTSTDATYTYEPVPTVESLQGPLSGTVTITGTGFILGSTTVKFGTGAAVTANVTNNTSATVDVPVGPSSGTVVALTVITPGGTSVDNSFYTYVFSETLTYTSTEANQTFTAPSAGTVTALVAGSNGRGSGGASITGTFSVAAGEVLTIVVGSGGSTYAGGTAGNGMISGSGGYSAVFLTTANANASGKPTAKGPTGILILAGGGGGAAGGPEILGGAGGEWNSAITPCSIGSNGNSNGGQGGQTTNQAGDGIAGGGGAQFQGELTGGGGGYYGGGRSTGFGSGGGGGSSYVNTQVYNIANNGKNFGSGQVLITFTDGIIAAPTVSGISPANGPYTGGNTVIITGTGFTENSTVTIGDGLATSVVFNASDGTLTVVVPATPVTGVVSVNVSSTDGGKSANNNLYTYNPAPTITGLSRPGGPVTNNAPLIISGTNLAGVTAVQFGAVSVSALTDITDSAFTVVPPDVAAPTTVSLSITTINNGPATYSTQFTYGVAVASMSTYIGVKVNNVPLTITGTGFHGVTNVYFGDTSVAANQATSISVNGAATVITCTPPNHAAGTVIVTVIASYGEGACPTEFTYSNLDPPSAPRNVAVQRYPAPAGPPTQPLQGLATWIAPASDGGSAILRYNLEYWGTDNYSPPYTFTLKKSKTVTGLQDLIIGDLPIMYGYELRITATTLIGTGPIAIALTPGYSLPP
jgi:hypothetical protein